MFWNKNKRYRVQFRFYSVFIVHSIHTWTVEMTFKCTCTSYIFYMHIRLSMLVAYINTSEIHHLIWCTICPVSPYIKAGYLNEKVMLGLKFSFPSPISYIDLTRPCLSGLISSILSSRFIEKKINALMRDYSKNITWFLRFCYFYNSLLYMINVVVGMNIDIDK